MSARREVASGTAHSPTPPTQTPPPPSSPPPPPPTVQGEPQSVTPSAAGSELSRSRRSRPPQRHGVEVISVQLPDASGPDRETSDFSLCYTPPYTSTNRPYRFSDHIHRDRHIFLKGASVGIGCGNDAGIRLAAEEQITPLQGWSGGRRGGAGGGGGGGRSSSVGGGVSSACSSWDSRGCTVDGIGNVYYRGQRLHPPAMALGQDRLPTLSRVQLGLSSAECSKLQQERRRRYPHIRPHNPPEAAARRPFNEQLNTYVDTQKRIRSVHSLEDLYAASPPPVLPYLATPPSPRRRQPPAPPRRPAAIRLQAATAALAPQPPPRVPPSQSLMRNLTGFNIKQPPAPLVPALPLTTITAVDSSSSNAALQRNSNNYNDDTPSGKTVSFRDPDAELKEARKALEATKQVSSNKTYADYFLSKEVNHGTFGHLFESYPKRVLTVHPGRFVRQRTEVAVPRSRMKLQQ